MRVVAVPQPGREARVRTEVACLCNATDRKLVEGHFPGIEKYPLLLGAVKTLLRFQAAP